MACPEAIKGFRVFFIILKIHFAKTIETQKGRLNFYFNKIYTANGERIHISFVEKNKSSSLLMEENKDQIWSIINRENCPEWIIELEAKFRTLIALHRELSNSLAQLTK